ncbi:MAG TPA: three-Cys-motif partner protein TcmP [Steroidobacteraceae bacterium]|jgi:three-Cys-motif partner protein|nr:three-Cys-motif partner protein TcmP [Steroidobacteraceae bacterium]
MAAPRTTVWELEPHTRAKHEILRRYLQAWIPILSQGGFKNILYIDGFAGPGRYAGGEDGSPIIAVKSALDHAARIKGNVFFLFVEEKRDRADVLQQCLDELAVPTNFHIKVAAGDRFAEAFEELKQFYIKRGRHLPPTFAFIDPFGWTGAPFEVVRFILGQPRCEILVTFMYEEINRFLRHRDQPANFDEFFGTEKWREGLKLGLSSDRNRFLHDIYLRQLKEVAGAKYARSFQMRNASGVTDYFLFYATNNLLGLQKMKEAMWRVDESGEFTFSDATDARQLLLIGKEPRYDVLAKQLRDRFRGRAITRSEVENFVLAETPFRETHYKRALKALELSDPPALEVIAAPEGRKRGTFPSPSMRLRFCL